MDIISWELGISPFCAISYETVVLRGILGLYGVSSLTITLQLEIKMVFT